MKASARIYNESEKNIFVISKTVSTSRSRLQKLVGVSAREKWKVSLSFNCRFEWRREGKLGEMKCR